MPNLKEEAQIEIDNYIRNHSLRSRYEIDKDLLSRGFEPEWIDESWQNRAKKQRKVDRYKLIEKRIFLINIFLLVWFFKPNLPVFYDSNVSDGISQVVLVPFVLLFFGGILLWYKRRRYGKFAEKPRYFLTVVPIIPLLILFLVSFLLYRIGYFSLEVEKGTDKNFQYQYKVFRDPNDLHSYEAVDYHCDNFGLLCFSYRDRGPHDKA